MSHRVAPVIFWGALIILLLIGLIGPPIPNATPTGTASGWLSGGLFSTGVLSAGLFSAGIFSAGIFSIGIFSAGVFSVGIFSFGTFALGIWAAGQMVRSWYTLKE